jgi:hypothetical protein
MQLQTTITVPAFPKKITYRTPVALIGSCFAANIGNAMQQAKFPTVVNPFGVLYNPQSIVQSLQRLRRGNPFTDDEPVCCNGLWTTFSHHSRWAHTDKPVFLQQANAALQQGKTMFDKAPFAVISLGTAWAYKHKATARVVSNCHKFPAGDFERVFLSAAEITELFAQEISTDPWRTWIFTVSPIRHWKDGAHGNQLSKATLLLAVEQLQQRFPNVLYFPAYELMMDELRDYRFYAEDMLHPSEQAVAYIWQRFAEAAFDEETTAAWHEVEKITAAQNHRPLHPHTAACLQFQTQLTEQIQSFSARYPFIKL